MLKNNVTNLGVIKCYRGLLEEVVKRRDIEPKPDKNCLEKPCKKKVKNVVLFC